MQNVQLLQRQSSLVWSSKHWKLFLPTSLQLSIVKDIVKDCLYDGKALSKEEADCIYQHYKGHEDHLVQPTSSDREDLKTCDPL